MAEHMTSNSHHDPAVGMHYMWNGGVDVSIFFFVILVDLNRFFIHWPVIFGQHYISLF